MSHIKMLKKESQVALPNSGETYIAEDGTVSMVLDDHHDTNYEPSDQEVKEYAEWLGMSLPEDNELLWIAQEGLKAPLPKEWKPCKTDTGEVYYFNFKTGDSIWDHPMDEHFKSKFKSEKERLKKAKENGGALNDALAKLPTRNNTIFTEAGVVKHEQLPSPLSSPRSEPKAAPAATASSLALSKSASSSQEEKPLATLGRSNSSTIKETPKAAATVTTTVTSVRKEESIPALNKASSGTFSLSTSKKEEEDHPVDSPRLVSEAEKILQDRVRQEAEADHKKLVEALEHKYNDDDAKIRRAHEDEVAEQKRQSNLSKRAAINKIEDQLQEELEQQQLNVDQRAKREVQRMEDEIERVREKIRDVQTSSLHRLEKESQEIDSKCREAIQAKVREIEGEISSIRIRHAKAQIDQVEQENQRLEIDLNRAFVEAKEKTSCDYESKANQLRANHAETVRKLREEAQKEMDEETKRAASANSGNHEQMIQELTRKEAVEIQEIANRAAQDVATLRAEEEQKRNTFSIQSDAEVALILRTATSSGDSGPQLEAIDADAEGRIRAANDRYSMERATWQQQAQRLREDRLQRASGSSSGTQSLSGVADEEAARIAAQTSQMLAEADLRYRQKEEALRLQLESEQRTSSQDATSAAIAAAVNRDYDQFVRQLQEQRKREEDQFQRSKEAAEAQYRRELAAYEDKVAAARGAPPPTTTQHITIPASNASVRLAAKIAIDDGIRSLHRELEQQYTNDSRQIRSELAEKHGKRILAMADELAEFEQSERRRVDSDLATDADEYERAELRVIALNSTAPQPNTSGAQQLTSLYSGVTPAELEGRLAVVRKEFLEKERSARAEFEEKITAANAQASATRQAIAAMAAVAPALQQPVVSHADPGLPPRSTTPLMRSSSPSGPQDPFAYLNEQQRGLAHRQEMLAQARNEWNHDLQSGGDGQLLQQAHEELGRREEELRRDVHSLKALNQYYATQHQPAAVRYSDPTASSPEAFPQQQINSQLFMALQKLNSKLDYLLSAPRTEHKRSSSRHLGDEVPYSSNKQKPSEKRKERTSSATRQPVPQSSGAKHSSSAHRRSSSTELAAKWGTILKDVSSKSKGSRVPQYEDAIRHYLKSE